LQDEEQEMAFVKAFRELMRLMNVLGSFSEFDHNHLSMNEQSFEDYKSKYLDLYDKARSHNKKESVSILDDLDFELELIHRDEINVTYIMRLLQGLVNATVDEKEQQKNKILETMTGDLELRSKRELIEKFINKNLPDIKDSESVPEEFEKFWNHEKQQAFKVFSETEKLDPTKLESIIGDYLFTERTPLRDDVIDMMDEKPKLKERATTAERLINKVTGYVDTFISGMGL